MDIEHIIEWLKSQGYNADPLLEYLDQLETHSDKE